MRTREESYHKGVLMLYLVGQECGRRIVCDITVGLLAVVLGIQVHGVVTVTHFAGPLL